MESQALLESVRDRYLDLYDLAPVGYATLDPDGLILELNLKAAELLGKERSRLLRTPFHTRVVAEERRRFLDHLRRTRNTRGTVEIEILLVAKRGLHPVHLLSKAIVASTAPRTTMVLTAMIDLAEKKQTESAMELSENRLRVALSAASAGAWEWSGPTDSVHWSKDHFALFGMRDGEFVPSFSRWIQCIHPADRGRAYQGGLHMTSIGEPVDVAYRVPLPDGKERWLRTIGKTIESRAGGTARAIGLTLDISPEKESEIRLKSLNAVLEERRTEAETHTAQLRSLVQELARAETREQARLADILHDHVQQTLVAADLNLARLARKAPDDDMKQAITNVAGFIHDALNTTRNLAKDFDPGILKEDGLVAALKWQAEAMNTEFGLHVAVEDQTDVEPSEYEESAIAFRAVKELLFNVVKHANTKEASVRLTMLGEDSICIEVADAGTGFDVYRLSRPDAHEHHGILRTRERIHALGGRFVVESAPGAGTTVRIIIPARTKKSPPYRTRSKPSATPREPHGGRDGAGRAGLQR